MEENKIIEVTVTYDYETYRDFFRFYLCKQRTSFWLCLILTPIFSVMLLVFGIVGGGQILFFLAALLLFIWIVFLGFYYIMPSKNYEKAKKIYQSEMTFHFFPDYVAIVSVSNMTRGNSTFRYEFFEKVFETEKAFYLAMENNQSYLIAKKYLNQFQVETLHHFFINQFGGRYQKY